MNYVCTNPFVSRDHKFSYGETITSYQYNQMSNNDKIHFEQEVEEKSSISDDVIDIASTVISIASLFSDSSDSSSDTSSDSSFDGFGGGDGGGGGASGDW